MTYKNHQAFYDDPDLYDETLFECSEMEIEFYVELAKNHKNVLYLGSGSGRLLKEMVLVNDNITGVEISKRMCEKCQKLLPDTRIINEDVLKLNLEEKFDLIIAPYEFLNHFSKDVLKKVIEVIDIHLEKGGEFVAAMKNPFECENKTNFTELLAAEINGKYFEKGYETVYLSQKKYVDFIERINLETNEYTLINMEWFYYFKEDLSELLNNIEIEKVWGAFDKSKFNEDSEVLLILATKP